MSTSRHMLWPGARGGGTAGLNSWPLAMGPWPWQSLQPVPVLPSLQSRETKSTCLAGLMLRLNAVMFLTPV